MSPIESPDLSFTEGELKLVNLFEGDDKINIVKSLVESKLKLIQIQNERLRIHNEQLQIQGNISNDKIDRSSSMATNVASFMKDLIISIVNGLDKVPAVIESYNRLEQMDSNSVENSESHDMPVEA